MPRDAAGCDLSSTTRLASGGTPSLKRAMTKSEVPRSISVFPGSTWTSSALAPDVMAVPRTGLRTSLAHERKRHGNQKAEGRRVHHLGAAEFPRRHGFVPIVGAAVVECLTNDGKLQETQRTGRRHSGFLNRG